MFIFKNSSKSVIKFLSWLCLVNFLILPNFLYAKSNSENSEIVSIKSLFFSANNEIELELSGVAEYKIFTLSKPERLVIEIQNAEQKNYKNPKKIPDFINKIEVESKNNSIFLNLYLTEKFIVEKTSFDYKKYILLCKITPKDSPKIPQKVVEKITENQPLETKKIDNPKITTEKKPESKIDNPKSIEKILPNLQKSNNAVKISEEKSDDLIVKQNEHSSVKYKIRNKNKVDPNVNKPTAILSSPSESTKRKPVIIIDAGHGGKDPGTIGNYARTKEKNITLSYAKELAKNLMNENKYRVYLTRDEDFFIPLDKRVAKSRKKKADLFISLHANSITDPSVSGFSIYTLSDNSSDKQAELLAQKENQADIINGIDFSGASKEITKTLIDLAQRESKNSSARLAKYIIREVKKSEIEILQNTHRFAGFMVLTAPDMASVLIELGYLSNKQEEKMLNSTSYRRHIAKTLSTAIDNYFNNYNN